jgi:hypothetical protein
MNTVHDLAQMVSGFEREGASATANKKRLTIMARIGGAASGLGRANQFFKMGYLLGRQLYCRPREENADNSGMAVQLPPQRRGKRIGPGGVAKKL